MFLWQLRKRIPTEVLRSLLLSLLLSLPFSLPVCLSIYLPLFSSVFLFIFVSCSLSLFLSWSFSLSLSTFLSPLFFFFFPRVSINLSRYHIYNRSLCNQYASVDKDGVKFMTISDFLKTYVGILDFENVNDKTVQILGNLVDQVGLWLLGIMLPSRKKVFVHWMRMFIYWINIKWFGVFSFSVPHLMSRIRYDCFFLA